MNKVFERLISICEVFGVKLPADTKVPTEKEILDTLDSYVEMSKMLMKQ
jgi:hypothetical protein